MIIYILNRNYIVNFIDIYTSQKLLMHVEKHDIIRYSAERIPDAIYVVFDVDKNPSLPALMCEIWAFEGGYDHAFHRFLEGDINVNKAVPAYEHQEWMGEILAITEYRAPREDLTDKEEFHFDPVPHEVSTEPSANVSIPYKVLLKKDMEELELIIPQWTPLQQIPLDKIREGTVVQGWLVEGVHTIMKVLRL